MRLQWKDTCSSPVETAASFALNADIAPARRTVHAAGPDWDRGWGECLWVCSGDPINYSDPFGLCPPANTDESDCASTFWADQELRRVREARW